MPDSATSARALPQGPRRNGSRLAFGVRRWRGARAQPDQMADREHQISAVHSVEVQLLDAVVDEIDHLLGADRRRDEAARRGIVLETVKAVSEPLRHARARAAGEIGGL